MEEKFMTQLTHLGAYKRIPMTSKPKVMPIYMSSAYSFEDSDICNDICYHREDGYLYGSYGNPTADALKEILVNIEGAEACDVYASGMAAITLAILSQVKSGDHIIANNVIYGNVFKFLKTELGENLGVEVTFVDFKKEDLAPYFKPNTKMVYMETISNPMIEVIDIAKVAEITHQHGARLMIDNTFATPIVCQPIKYGADIVVYSATKFMNGHSDIMAGIVLGSKEVLDRVVDLSHTFGPTISPFDVWLLMRSMRTLDIRVERHSHNAMKLAEFLDQHPKTGKVYYPGLPSFPDHEAAKKYFNKGLYGGMLAVDMGSYENIAKFVEKAQLSEIVASLGTYTTSLCDTTITHSGMTAAERKEAGLPEGLLRISTGLENIDDIIGEFERILEEL
ncbi:trans-sulfuration enzyme family protein [Fusibacter ferrireducens]|uniref:Aminotransferase class I/II-fold pyridoxal phosphate-dependent enzyme n=1 Tax=Fusibacter ferrireducens TaxID=2785058 RepID=A0ABR9ZU44_9FIRM|nr:aminotransferase class I/II-fold pyridoxal phosphate-dependent enzyme [Fusibacter ferrireducens]MBF4693405.1 aminotransferase class I/II-fold pyridoxal phosphate-dependent enzyme [Fusibacter ferrireducens]